MRSIEVRQLALVFLAACGGAHTVPASKPDAPDVQKPAVMKSTDAARIENGDAQFGCIGWSTKENAAACVTGERGTMGTSISLVDTGSKTLSADVSDPIANADELNALLAEGAYMKFTYGPTELAQDTPVVVGGATFLFSSVDTPSDADNTAPQFKTKLTATCGGAQQVVFEHDEEGRGYSASVRRIGGHALVELEWSLAREGEYGSGMDVVVVDTKTCESIGG